MAINFRNLELESLRSFENWYIPVSHRPKYFPAEKLSSEEHGDIVLAVETFLGIFYPRRLNWAVLYDSLICMLNLQLDARRMPSLGILIVIPQVLTPP